MSPNILLFLFALFLLRFSPLYFFGIQNTFLTTHVISVTIFISLLLALIYKAYKEKGKKQTRSFDTETILILIFFITQSLSIIGAQNILVFLQRYSKIFIGFSLYLLIKAYISKYKNKAEFFDFIIKIILFGSTVGFFLQLLLFVFPDIYFGAGQYFIYSNVLDITSANFKVGKFFDDSYLEIIIPIFIYYFIKEKNSISNRFSILFLLLAVGFLSFVSNFRYRILTFFFSLFLSIFVLKIKEKGILNKIFGLVLLTIVIFKTINPLITQFTRYTVIDRFVQKEEYEDYSSISWRLKMFDKSIEFANAYPFGVGLGNFYDNVSGSKFINTFFNERKKISLAALQSGPHNIFFQFLGETGFVGLFAFILLLCFFIQKDLILISQKNSDHKKVFILLFWTLIFIVQFFPAINLTFYSLFFMLRALI